MTGADRIRVVQPQERAGSWSRMLTESARVSSPTSRFGSRFADLAERAYMSNAHCVIYVARRVAEVRNAHVRARWFGGRFYNWLTGSSADYVVLSGAVLASSFKWLGETVPEGFPRGANLELQFELAEKLDADLRAKAKAEGLIS